MPAFVAIVFNVAMLTFVAGSMVTLGLGITVAQIIAPFKNVRMVILAIISNFLVTLPNASRSALFTERGR